ncbi:MAG: hypothetical protein V7K77_10460 [Nostoc sp.]|uniref:hypothetical protein n=1 Tax=Nostoc sp. TaxID=1180 RepID=UPI002FF694F4
MVFDIYNNFILGNRMLSRQDYENFQIQWIITNTVSCFLAFLIWLIVGLVMDNIKPDLDYWLKNTIFLISFFSPGVVIGLSQWLLLLKKIPTISWLWILSNLPGLYLGFISTAVACGFTLLFIINYLQGTHELTQGFLIGSIGGAIGGAVGGIITGIIQHFLIRKNFSVNYLWIITSTVSWSISWSLGWTLVFINSRIFNAIGSFFGITSSSEASYMFGLPLPFFGIVFGFVNAIITGKVLVRLLRQSKQTHS